MSGNEETIRWWLDQALLLYIVCMLLLKALVLRKESWLGAALAANSAVFATIFLGSFLSAWWPGVFRSDAWIWFLRVMVAASVTGVLIEFRRAFGSWRTLFHEARHGLRTHNGLTDKLDRHVRPWQEK